MGLKEDGRKAARRLRKSPTHPTPSGTDVELHPLAEELLDAHGLCNYMVELAQDAKKGGNRDFISALTLRRQIGEFFGKLQTEARELAKADELADELRETQRLLRAHNGGSTSFDQAPQLPDAEGTRPNQGREPDPVH